MRESDIQLLIRLALSKAGACMFRNNTGQAWGGDVARIDSSTVIIKNARLIRFGLVTGSSDLIGFTPKLITPELVGRLAAIFTAVEVKAARGRTTVEQKNFIQRVIEAGGIGIVAKSELEAVGELTSWQGTARR